MVATVLELTGVGKLLGSPADDADTTGSRSD
jgi:hypothetical protein